MKRRKRLYSECNFDVILEMMAFVAALHEEIIEDLESEKEG